MPQYFDFSSLIAKYASAYTLITYSGGGYDDAGEYHVGTKTEQDLQCAIIKFSEARRLRAEGVLSEKDLRLFSLSPIVNGLTGFTVLYEGCIYSLEQSLENSAFTGVWSYRMKFVSVFDESSGADTDFDGYSELNKALEDRLSGVLVKKGGDAA